MKDYYEEIKIYVQDICLRVFFLYYIKILGLLLFLNMWYLALWYWDLPMQDRY